MLHRRFVASNPYSAIYIADASKRRDEKASHLLWDDEHHRQGFTWRPRGAGFGLPWGPDHLIVSVHTEYKVILHDRAIRAILLPLTLLPPGKIEVDNVGSEELIGVPYGEFSLLFQCGWPEDVEDEYGRHLLLWIRLDLIPGFPSEPMILRADAELDPPAVLNMDPVSE